MGYSSRSGGPSTPQRARKSTAGCRMPSISARTCGLASKYSCTWGRTCSLGWPFRVAKKSFTGGWVNRYVDNAAATPALTPAQSAGEQFGGAGGGGAGGWALAPAAPRNVAPANARAPTAPTTARYPGRPDANIIAASPSSNDWRIHWAGSRVEAPSTTNLAVQDGRRTAVETDVEIAGIVAINVEPG